MEENTSFTEAVIPCVFLIFMAILSNVQAGFLRAYYRQEIFIAKNLLSSHFNIYLISSDDIYHVILFFSQVSEESRSILTVLFVINVELFNLTNVFVCCSYIYVIVVDSMSFFAAQIVVSVSYVLSFLLSEVSLAISLFKILLVTHFYLIFPYEPSKLANCVLMIAAALAFIPSIVIFTYQTANGQMVSNSLPFLTKLDNYLPGIPYFTFYLSLWLVLAITMMLIALFYIPHFLKENLSSHSIEMAEANCVRRQVSIKRLFLGFIGTLPTVVVALVGNNNSLTKEFPNQIYVATLSMNMVLMYFFLEKPVIIFFKRKCTSLMLSMSILPRGATVEPIN